MQIVEPKSFKNEASRRFHDYLYHYMDKNEERKKEVYAAFTKADAKNPSSFFSALRSGKTSVTTEQITIAKDKFKLNPAYVFEVSDQAELGFANNYILSETDEPTYGIVDADAIKHTGEKLHAIFRKHGTEIKSYATEQLGISRIALHKIFRGESRPFFDQVLKICEDHGESLEQFRTTPLPKGHYMAQLQLQSQLIEQYKARIDEMQSQTRPSGNAKRASG